MKTVLFVVAFVLGALLTWYLAPRLPPPIGCAPETPEPEAVTRQPELREADVKISKDRDTNKCKLKTYPNKLPAFVGDPLLWTIDADEDCVGYAQELTIELKAHEDPNDLQILDAEPGTARAVVPARPKKCPPDERCYLDYTATATGHEGSVEEDPKIDIW